MVIPQNVFAQLKIHEDYWDIMARATACQLMKNFDKAIENYYLAISQLALDDYRNLNYTYGELGISLTSNGQYEEALLYLTRYINYYKPKIDQSNFSKLNSYTQLLGKVLVARGICKAKLENPEGAVVDLNHGISFLERQCKLDRYSNRDYLESLEVGYVFRGLQKIMVSNNASIGCSDFQKAMDLGNEDAINLIKKFCN